jgi:hypothetical protein
MGSCEEHLFPSSSRSIDIRKQGFVPFDGGSSKRKRQEALGNIRKERLASLEPLESLILLVSLLSDTELVEDDVPFIELSD